MSVVQPCRASLPWSNDFESYTHDDPVTSAGGGGADWTGSSGVKIQSNAVHACTGNKYVYVPAEEGATNTFASDNPTRVWIDLKVKPSRQSQYATGMPDYDTDAAAFFFFNSNGYAVVRTASGWSTNSTVVGGSTVVTCTVNQASYNRVTVFQNYTSKKWALYVDDYMVGERLSFINSSLSSFDRFALRNGTYLDNVWVNDYISTDDNNPLNGEMDGNGAGTQADRDDDGSHDVWEVHHWDTASLYRSRSDPDGDGKFNEEEWINGTNPRLAGSSSWGIPYFQMFEIATASLNITNAWRGLTPTISGGGSVRILEATQLQGERIMALNTASVEFASAYADTEMDGTNVWVQMYSKPSPYYTGGSVFPNVDSTTVASFIVQRGTGLLYMYSNNTWVAANGAVTTVPTNKWLGFAVHLDYKEREWDLYVSTNASGDATYGDIMQRANIAPLAMNVTAGSVTQFTGFAVDTELPTYLDALAVSPGYEECLATDTNLIVQERIADRLRYVTLPPKNYDAQTNAPPRTDKLEGLLGDDLSRGLAAHATDHTRAGRVYLYDASFASHRAHHTGGGNWSGPGTSESVDNGDAVMISREPGADFSVFYPFSTNDNSVLALQTIRGPGDTGQHWTLLSYRKLIPSEMAGGDGTDWDLPVTPSNFDQIWLYRNGRYINLYYSQFHGGWRRGASLANETLYPGEVFWYFRRTGNSTSYGG